MLGTEVFWLKNAKNEIKNHILKPPTFTLIMLLSIQPVKIPEKITVFLIILQFYQLALLSMISSIVWRKKIHDHISGFHKIWNGQEFWRILTMTHMRNCTWTITVWLAIPLVTFCIKPFKPSVILWGIDKHCRTRSDTAILSFALFAYRTGQKVNLKF